MTVETFRLLTYNIWLRPPPFVDGQAARVEALPAHLEGFDAVVLCEAFHRRLSRRLFEALSGAYPHQCRPAPRTNPGEPGLRLWGGGVAILSRWPVERTGERSFAGILGHPDSHANKGALYAQINKRGRRYHLFGAHTQAAPESYVRLACRAVGLDAEERGLSHRQAQFDRLRAFIVAQAIPPHEPVLIAGDLNTDRLNDREQFEDMLARLDARFDERIAGSTFDPASNPLVRGERPQWLDYVLWSRAHLEPSSSRIEVLAPRGPGWRRHPLGRTYADLSDHYAVLAELTFAT